MNRQVGPSIVLSVLIVCFFAVALFQHDPPRSARSRGQNGSFKGIARSAAGAGAPGDKSAVPTGLAEVGRPISSEREIGVRSAGRDGTSPYARLASARGGILEREQSAARDGLGTKKERAPIEISRQPLSEFTVVVADETLEDVARRVYGSTDSVDSLWRANRDSLPRKSSLLTAGVVLRTPSLR
jgi:nucleoid-associated protein YgaU